MRVIKNHILISPEKIPPIFLIVNFFFADSEKIVLGCFLKKTKKTNTFPKKYDFVPTQQTSPVSVTTVYSTAPVDVCEHRQRIDDQIKRACWGQKNVTRPLIYLSKIEINCHSL